MSSEVQTSGAPERQTDERELLEFASKLVSYNSETGVITWLPRENAHRFWKQKYAGKPAGTVARYGYIALCVEFQGKGRKVLAHRLAWFIAHGKVPANQIDHINRDPGDNRISNLRDVDRSQNQRNKALSSRNTSGYSGVFWNRSVGRWFASVTVNNKHNYLGTFDDREEAYRVVKSFRAQHGFSPTHGEPAGAALQPGAHSHE